MRGERVFFDPPADYELGNNYPRAIRDRNPHMTVEQIEEVMQRVYPEEWARMMDEDFPIDEALM